MIAEFGKGLKLSAKCPDFNLVGIDGKKHSLHDFTGKILVVIFTCNHCPYAQAYQKRIVNLQKAYSDINIVAINSNDDSEYPEDSFDNMIARAKDFQGIPYLRDANQKIARAFGAQVTPDCFVFDQNKLLRYRGRIDDNWEHPEYVTIRDLENAIKDIIADKDVRVPESRAIGCSIKWKPVRL